MFEGVYHSGSLVDGTCEYTYDAIGRLIEATGRELAALAQPEGGLFDTKQGIPHANDADAVRKYREAYDYDAAGNLTRMDHRVIMGAGSSVAWERRYDYEEASNRLRATSLPIDLEEAFSAHYHYDTHGNIDWMPSISASRSWDGDEEDEGFCPSMMWNDREELISADKSTGCVSYFQYDASGERVRQVVDKGVLHERLYLGGWELYRKTSGATLDRAVETLHVTDGASRVAMIETRTTPAADGGGPVERVRYQYGNHLGSACLELDANGGVMTYEEYLPYGQVAYSLKRDGSGDEPRRFRFTGMEQDETGLQYHSARYYAPWLGRWTSADPIRHEAESSLFRYAGDNPIGFADRAGKQQVPARPPPRPPPTNSAVPPREDPVTPPPSAAPPTNEPRRNDAPPELTNVPFVDQGRLPSCQYSSTLIGLEVIRLGHTREASTAIGNFYQEAYHRWQRYSAAQSYPGITDEQWAEYADNATLYGRAIGVLYGASQGTRPLFRNNEEFQVLSRAAMEIGERPRSQLPGFVRGSFRPGAADNSSLPHSLDRFIEVLGIRSPMPEVAPGARVAASGDPISQVLSASAVNLGALRPGSFAVLGSGGHAIVVGVTPLSHQWFLYDTAPEHGYRLFSPTLIGIELQVRQQFSYDLYDMHLGLDIATHFVGR